jgi:two-component system cell cycle sensor histidine kinase/response regulator CckA
LDSTRGSETILLVEDEEFLRHVLTDLLTHLGYQVLGAANGKEALTLAAAFAGNIDVLVTDLRMPGMAGPELEQALRSSRPNFKVIFVSGGDQEGFALKPGAILLRKPFTIKMLCAKVREVMET